MQAPKIQKFALFLCWLVPLLVSLGCVRHLKFKIRCWYTKWRCRNVRSRWMLHKKHVKFLRTGLCRRSRLGWNKRGCPPICGSWRNLGVSCTRCQRTRQRTRCRSRTRRTRCQRTRQRTANPLSIRDYRIEMRQQRKSADHWIFGARIFHKSEVHGDAWTCLHELVSSRNHLANQNLPIQYRFPKSLFTYIYWFVLNSLYDSGHNPCSAFLA